MKNYTYLFVSFSITLLFIPIATQELEIVIPSTEAPDEQDFDETIFNWSRTFAQAMDIAHKKHYAITNPRRKYDQSD